MTVVVLQEVWIVVPGLSRMAKLKTQYLDVLFLEFARDAKAWQIQTTCEGKESQESGGSCAQSQRQVVLPTFQDPKQKQLETCSFMFESSPSAVTTNAM